MMFLWLSGRFWVLYLLVFFTLGFSLGYLMYHGSDSSLEDIVLGLEEKNIASDMWKGRYVNDEGLLLVDSFVDRRVADWVYGLVIVMVSECLLFVMLGFGLGYHVGSWLPDWFVLNTGRWVGFIPLMVLVYMTYLVLPEKWRNFIKNFWLFRFGRINEWMGFKHIERRE